jgi:hypothetical protein
MAYPAPNSMNKLTDRQSLGPPGHPPDEASYEVDFVLWADRQAYLLRHSHFAELDQEHLIVELEDMAGSQRRELRSRLIVLLVHLLKCQYQPERKSSSWMATLSEQRSQIALQLEDSPSLRIHLMTYAEKAYPSAVTRASLETMLPKSSFPVAQPFTEVEMLDLDFIP